MGRWSEAPVSNANVEAYFPRGKYKAKPASTVNADGSTQEKRFVKLFDNKPEENDWRKARKDKRKEERSAFALMHNSVPSLTYEDLREGMVMSATVASISDYKVVVCLPFYLHATLAITNISSKFTELVRKAADDHKEDDMDVDDVPSMEAMFRVGQFLVVGISSIKKSGKDVFDVNVTLDPKMVMANRNLSVGDMCVASVESKEDYGYSMDLGSPAFSGFLSQESADSYSKNLPIGSVILCYVEKKSGTVLSLKCDQDKLYNMSSPTASLYNTMPGSLIETKVVKILDNGLKVKYGDNSYGYIHKDLLPSTNDDHERYKIGQKVSARIVIVITSLNSFIMSAKQFFPCQSNWVPNCSFGEVFTDVFVTRVLEDQLCINLKLGVRGIAPLSYAQGSLKDVNKLKDVYEAGNTVKCRVIYLDHYSGHAVVTLMKEHIYSTEMEGFKIGDVVVGSVKGHNEYGVELFCGDRIGFIRNDFLSDTPVENVAQSFHIGRELHCRIIGLDTERCTLRLTSKPTLVKTDTKIITSSDVEVGDISLGVVSRINNENMATIVFFNNIIGRLFGHKCTEDLFMGKTINCEVVKVNHNTGSIIVKRHSDANIYKKPRELLKGRPKIMKIGEKYKARITSVTKKSFEVVVECLHLDVVCLVPFYHLTDCQAMTETIKSAYQVNDYLNKIMYAYDDPDTGFPILSMKETLKFAYESNTYMDTFAGLTKDCDILGVVKSFEQDYMLVDTLVKDCKRCVVPLNKIFLPEGDQLQDILEVGQTIVTQMVSKVEDEREVTATCDLTGDKHISKNYLTEYLKGLVENFNHLRLLEKNKALRKYRIGWVYQAKVKSVTDIGATLEMEGGVTALAPASNYGHNKPEPEAEVDVLVLFVDYQSGVLEVCCDETLVKPRLEAFNAQNSSSLERGIGVGTVMKGEIVLTRTELNLQILYVMEPPRYKGKIVYVPDLYEEADETNTESSRNVVEVSVKFKTSRRECIGTDEQEILIRKRQREPSTDASSKKKIKSELPAIQIPDELYCQFLGKKAAEKYIKKEIKQEVYDPTFSSVVNTNFSEDNKDDIVMDVSMPSKSVLEDPGWDFNATKITLPAWGKVSIWGDDESESETEAVDGKKKDKTRLSKKEARQLRKQEELDAVRQENKIVQGENLPPQSPEEFERVVASSPDSSLVWIQYMAHFLQSCQYDQAREIAKTAINRINFREETEILNVYLAWLNLENAFGTSESLEAVLKEAVQRNDEYKIYSQMADIFDTSNKVQESERIFKILTKKFGKVKEVWIRYGLLFFKHARVEDGRNVFTKSLKKLEARDAADISAKFAQLEFKYGDQERGKTMYEKLVSTYPKRNDIWRSYADQLTRIGDIPATRALYTRISTLGLKAKKMKPLFAKWLEFETTYGSEEQQGVVRAAALKYLNTKLAEDETVHEKIQEIKSKS